MRRADGQGGQLGHGGTRKAQEQARPTGWNYRTISYGMQWAMSVAGTSAIPYYYWCKRVGDRRRRRGEEGISTGISIFFTSL